MGAVTSAMAGLCALMLTVSPASARQSPAVLAWRSISTEASARFGIPVDWIERVMQAESAGHVRWNGRPIRSRAGAMGLMQLMPATWGEMRSRLGLGADPDDPRDNILAGSFYLRLMYERFGYPGLFGAYNAGPRRYADYLAGRASLPGETLAYLGSVSEPGKTLSARPVAGPISLPPTLFMVRHSSGTAGRDTIDNGLFAVRFDAP
ncbi:MAG TPA: lytic transglycosylase domain-containing protein [Sphingobium sp.]|uniref:lytic transglycosylase domain-containing protein n=1 Tax=Sphingobium sp. TaxID=1912891 RepID=UPI002ED62EE1